MTHSRITEIEYVRALAIALTFASHANFFVLNGDPSYIWLVTNIGQCWGGVDIFFCISGFVISRQLWVTLDHAKIENRTTLALAQFYVRRSFRILPIAFFWATIILAASFLFNKSGAFGNPRDNFGSYFAALFFYENIYLTTHLFPQFSIYWSLAIEEQFYIIFPFLALIVAPRYRWQAIMILIGIQIFLPRPADQSNLFSMVRYDALLMGVAIYLWSETKNFLMFYRNKMVLRIVCLLLVFLVILIPVQLQKLWFFTGLMDLCAAAIVAIAALQAGVFNIRNEVCKSIVLWVGSRSYGLYVAHMPMIFILKEINVRYGFPIIPDRVYDFRFVFMIISICIFAEVLYRNVERPLRLVGIRIANKMNSGRLYKLSSAEERNFAP